MVASLYSFAADKAAGRHRANEDVKKGESAWRNLRIPFERKARRRSFCLENLQKSEKRILFSKNKAGELLETKGNGKKQTENEPKTKRAMLLKTNKAPKNKAKTNRKTKRSILLKIKGQEKTNRKQTEIRAAFLRLHGKTTWIYFNAGIRGLVLSVRDLSIRHQRRPDRVLNSPPRFAALPCPWDNAP